MKLYTSTKNRQITIFNNDNLFQNYFKNIPSSILEYDYKNIKEYIQNCKNSLMNFLKEIFLLLLESLFPNNNR